MAYVKPNSVQSYAATEAVTVHELSGQMSPSNEIDDILVLNIAIDGNKSATTPTGWTASRANNEGGIYHYVYYRRATAVNEAIPDITISGADTLSATYLAVYGCPTASTPIGNTAANTGGSATPTWTSISYSAYSTILYLGGMDLDVMQTVGDKLVISAVETTGDSAIVAKEFDASSGTTGSVVGTADASDGWQTYTLELLDNGSNEVPLEFVDPPFTASPTMAADTANAWRDALCDSAVDFDGTALTSPVSFDAATDVDPATNYITLTAHPYTTGDVVRADANGNTLPTGVTDGDYYYIHVIDTNTVQLEDATSQITGTDLADYYDSASPTVVSITADGTGTCRFEFSGVLNFGTEIGGNIERPPVGSDTGNNYHSFSTTLSTARDMSDETLLTFIQTNANVKAAYITLIDSDGDWKSWLVSKSGSTYALTQAIQVNPANTLESHEYQTFDSSSVKHIVFSFLRASISDRKSGYLFDIASSGFLKTIKAKGGQGTVTPDWDEVYGELQFYTSATSSKPSASQLTFEQVIQFSDGTSPVKFADGAKSIAFPPPSDAVTTFTTYLVESGILFDLTATCDVTMGKELIASSGSFGFDDLTSDASATIAISNSILQNPLLDVPASATVTGCTIIGAGTTCDLSGADIDGCTFEDCKEINAGSSTVDNSTLSGTTAGASEAAIAFEANSSMDGTEIDVTGTSAGYHIELGTAVTAFTLADVTFTGTPGTDKIHVLRTTGTVTISISGSTTLIASDVTSEGATVVVSAPSITLTIEAQVSLVGAEVRIYDNEIGGDSLGTELDGIESNGSATYAYSGSAGNNIIIQVMLSGYEEFLTEITFPSSSQTLPITLRAETNA